MSGINIAIQSIYQGIVLSVFLWIRQFSSTTNHKDSRSIEFLRVLVL